MWQSLRGIAVRLLGAYGERWVETVRHAGVLGPSACPWANLARAAAKLQSPLSAPVAQLQLFL